MLKALEPGDTITIIVMRLDRLARNEATSTLRRGAADICEWRRETM